MRLTVPLLNHHTWDPPVRILHKGQMLFEIVWDDLGYFEVLTFIDITQN